MLGKLHLDTNAMLGWLYGAYDGTYLRHVASRTWSLDATA